MYQTQHAKSLRFEISVGKDDDDTTLEEFEGLVRKALEFARDHGAAVFNDPSDVLRFHNLTFAGGHYILDGKVCVAKDYDPAIKDRKPGTFPPPWAGGPSPSAVKASYLDTASVPTPVQTEPKPVDVKPETVDAGLDEALAAVTTAQAERDTADYDPGF